MSSPAGRKQSETGQGSGTNEQSQSPPTATVTVAVSSALSDVQAVSVPPAVVTSSAGYVTVPVATPIVGTTTITTAVAVPRRRPRTDAQASGGAGSSSGGAGGDDDERRAAQRRRGELVEVPRGPPLCYVCNRAFGSWKAVFGHMRVHKVGEDRARSGAFPPPVFTPPASPERDITEEAAALLPERLLKIAADLTAASSSSSAAAAATPTPTPPLARYGIDLNEPQLVTSPPQPEAPTAQQQPSSPPQPSGRFDLNRDPNNGGGDDNNA